MKCSVCEGKKAVSVEARDVVMQIKCTHCKGTGYEPDDGKVEDAIAHQLNRIATVLEEWLEYYKR